MSNYEDFYSEIPSYAMEGVAVVLGIVLVVLLIALAVGIVSYVLQSIGLYRIASRRGIKHAWLSWVPVGNYWVIGCIADQYRYVVKGQVKNRRTVLLVLYAVTVAVGMVTSVISAAAGIVMTEQIVTSGAQIADGVAVGGAMGVNALLSLISAAVSITMLVFYCICLYDLYSSCNPANNVVFLVLGIFLNFLTPFFIFSCRNKDLGMPPRKQPQPAAQIPQEHSEPRAPVTEEPWQQPVREEEPWNTQQDQ